MTKILVDTHTILWAIFDDGLLSEIARAMFSEASESKGIFISNITLVEVNYLAGKKNFPYTTAYAKLMELVVDPTETLKVIPLTIEVAKAIDLIPRDQIPDMPDRIIAATCIANSLPLVSADSKIQESPSLKSFVPVIW